MNDYSRIVEVKGASYANKLLPLGWRYVGFYTRLYGEGTDVNEGDEYASHILGWLRSQGESQIPNLPPDAFIDQ
jgi:hypothetical protein